MSNQYREKVVLFGARRSLVGVLTISTVGANTKASPVVVIPNSGVVHRVGPNRLAVRLAREFAGLGLSTLRFDLSGIGDSMPPSDSISLDECVDRDIDQAMSYLQNTHGAERFIFAGLCSGARDSFRIAYRDSRVLGAVLIDCHAYQTPEFYVRYYGSKLIQSETWRNIFSEKHRYLLKIQQHLKNQFTKRVSSGKPERDIREMPRWPTREQFGMGLLRILARKTHLLFVYTDGLIGEYNYKKQFFDVFPRASKSEFLRVAFFPEADHTFGCEDHRQWLFEMIKGWMTVVRLIDGIKSN